jgi:hypothetical protein
MTKLWRVLSTNLITKFEDLPYPRNYNWTPEMVTLLQKGIDEGKHWGPSDKVVEVKRKGSNPQHLKTRAYYGRSKFLGKGAPDSSTVEIEELVNDNALNNHAECHPFDIPSHVPSVKSLSDGMRNEEVSSAVKATPPTQLTRSVEAYTHLGEGSHVPEHLKIQKECALEELVTKLKQLRNDTKGDESTHTCREAINVALRTIEKEFHDAPPEKGKLKQGKADKSIDPANIVSGPRARKIAKIGESSSVEEPTTNAKKVVGKTAGGFLPGMRVSILTTHFDGDDPGSYSNGQPPTIEGNCEVHAEQHCESTMGWIEGTHPLSLHSPRLTARKAYYRQSSDDYDELEGGWNNREWCE